MKPRMQSRGYRFRVYIFAGFLVFLVVSSFSFTFGVAWYSKKVTILIVEKDFIERERERSMIDLLLAMDRNRKKYFLLEKDEYRSRFFENVSEFRQELMILEGHCQADSEKRTWKKLKDRFEVYLQSDPLSLSKDGPMSEGVSDLPLEEVHHLLRLNQDRIDQRIEQISKLEDKTVQAGLLWAALSVAVAFLSSFFLIRSITRPIDLLRKGTKEIAEGRFYHRVDLPIQDELGDLADSFNEMAYQLKKLDDMKADFIAIVSHELKTPLTSMKEAVELLLEETVGPISPKQKHLLNINAEGIQKLSGFVEDILNLTRMEGGLAPLYQVRFDFKALLEESLKVFHFLAEKNHIRLGVEIHPDPLPPIYGDAERLKQVLSNLLSNAIYFTPVGGEVLIKIEYIKHKISLLAPKGAVRQDSAKHWLQVRISDTGEGIPKEEWKRVFDKFYQILEKSNRSNGSGLGLTIARQIVEAHGGSIQIEESSEKGTTFVFVLPQDGFHKEHEKRREVFRERLQIETV